MNLGELNIFKIGTIIAGILIGIVAILIFSGKFPGIDNPTTKTTNKKEVVVWGTIDDATMKSIIDEAGLKSGKLLNINYRYIAKDRFANTVTQAASQGNAPDIILSESGYLTSISSLLSVIPYNTGITELEYKQTFVDGTHQFATPFGALFYPLAVDPLITSYNKKILSENNFTEPLSFWAELPKYQTAITTYDYDKKPVISAFSMGANNVTANKGILSAMLMQLGHMPIRVVWGTGLDKNAKMNYILDMGTNVSNMTDGTSDLVKILRLQTAFSDPQKTTFTWSEISKNDRDVFAAGNMAMYFGYASDLNYIRSKNNTLDIGVRFLPQMSDNKILTTTGKVYGIGVLRTTQDFSYSVETAINLIGSVFSSQFANTLGIASARKDTLTGNSGSEYSEIMNRSALLMKVAYDDLPSVTDGLVYDLYDNILSGRKSIYDAADVFDRAFEKLYDNNKI